MSWIGVQHIFQLGLILVGLYFFGEMWQYRSIARTLMAVTLFLLYVHVATPRMEFSPNIDGASITVTRKDFFSEEHFACRWMKPPDYDFPAWCAKGKDGRWQPFIVEGHPDSGEPDYPSY